MKYFKAVESVYYEGKYMLLENHENLRFKTTCGSYAVFPSRLLGMEYPEFLRYCRDVVGAELVGKKSLYIVPYFTDKKKLEALIKELDLRVDLILK